MKTRIIAPLFVLFFLFCLTTPMAFAGAEQTKVGDTEYSYYIAPDFTTTADYEKLVIEVQAALNALSPMAAKLNGYSDNTTTLGYAKSLTRLTDVTESVIRNLISVIENYTPAADEKTSGILADLKARLEKVAGYSFGPTRSETFEINPISNETKGEIEVVTGYKDDTDDQGKVIRVPVVHVARYAVTPGLKDTKQDEREVIVIDRLAEGGYKIAIGIFYPGQNKVTMEWDERTYNSVDAFLAYHNVCKAQKEWLKCATGKCVPYSENTRVTK